MLAAGAYGAVHSLTDSTSYFHESAVNSAAATAANLEKLTLPSIADIVAAAKAVCYR